MDGVGIAADGFIETAIMAADGMEEYHVMFNILSMSTNLRNTRIKKTQMTIESRTKNQRLAPSIRFR